MTSVIGTKIKRAPSRVSKPRPLYQNTLSKYLELCSDISNSSEERSITPESQDGLKPASNNVDCKGKYDSHYYGKFMALSKANLVS